MKRFAVDLARLDVVELDRLAADIRAFLVDKVSSVGGHLGSNLGVVELTIALHRVFRSPRDVLLFDTGHQGYVHKLLTGREGGFDGLRQAGGMSGYPAREESVHDVIENSHASTALSYADGVARGFRLRGEGARRVVAVVGDGALTGGMCWEAMNNLGASPELPVVVVLNDNGRSYAPTVGGLAAHLEGLRSSTVDSSVFKNMGLAYIGPVDGHDVAALESAFQMASALGRPTVVHCVTRKGKGYLPAELDDECMHAVGVLDPATGRPVGRGAETWTSVFGSEIAAIGAERPDVVCLTAAMPGPTGLGRFASRFPDRFFDVGIAEQHAVTAAAGMAMTGLHPVVAVYSAFLTRAFDQLLMDVALHGLPVTFVLDRAGITGPDGASHHGMWDASLLPVVPGIRVGAPRDAEVLRSLLREAVESAGPSVVRYPKAAVGPAIPAVRQAGGLDVLRYETDARVLLVGVGALAAESLAAADALAARGVPVTVVDPKWIAPLNPTLVEMAAEYRLVLAVEDTASAGALGGRLAQALAAAGSDTCAGTCALPTAFVPHGGREQLLSGYALDADGIAATVLERLDLLGERVGLRPVA